MANEIFITEEKCTGCTACVKVCPTTCIDMHPRSKSHPKWKKQAIIDVERCIFCGACVTVCDELGQKTETKLAKKPDFFFAISMIKDEIHVDIDTAAYKGVWCYAEQRHGKLMPTIYELLYTGRKLAADLNEELSAVIIGKDVTQYAQDLIEHGADQVYVFDDPLFEHFLDEPYTEALTELIRREKPNKLLLPATILGRSFASRVAITAQTGITADATHLTISPQTRMLHAERPSFGGNLMATILCEKHRPEMATVRPMSFPRAEKIPGHQGKIIPVKFDASKWKIRAKFIRYEPEKSEIQDISQADIIVSGGRGVGGATGFEPVTALAKALGGAVGASRATVDAGWIPYRHQVGLTGRTVHPKLYIACGISGQIQHLAGMGSSDVIVAINKDSDCPMMKLATLSIEGDLFEIIPAILEELKKRRGHN